MRSLVDFYNYAKKQTITKRDGEVLYNGMTLKELFNKWKH